MTDADTPVKTDTRTISTWRGLLFRSAFASVVVLVLVQILARGIIAPLAVGALLFVGGLVWLRRPGRGPVMYLAVVSALLLLANLNFALPALGHPDSAFDFVSVGAVLIALAVTAGVALTELRSHTQPRRAPRLIGLGAFGLVVLMGIVGAIAAAGVTDDAPTANDVSLKAKGAKWTAKTLTAKAGDVGIFIDNADSTRHDFTISDAGAKVSADLPERTKRRVTFPATPGTYEYHCTIHPEQMKGTLTVQ